MTTPTPFGPLDRCWEIADEDVSEVPTPEPAPDRTPTGDLRERLVRLRDLRERLAEAVGLARNGPASDGRGWYRTAGDRLECHAVADAVLPVVEAETAALRAALDKAHEMAAEYSKRGIENGERAEALETDLRQERAVHEQTVQRAEEAERHRDEALAAVQRVRGLADAAVMRAGLVAPTVPARDVLAALDQPEETP